LESARGTDGATAIAVTTVADITVAVDTTVAADTTVAVDTTVAAVMATGIMAAADSTGGQDLETGQALQIEAAPLAALPEVDFAAAGAAFMGAAASPTEAVADSMVVAASMAAVEDPTVAGTAAAIVN